MVRAWAIRLGLSNFDSEMVAQGRSTMPEYGLMGVYMFASGAMETPAITTRLFYARHQARKLLPRIRETWPRARVVRVTVDIREVDA